MQELPGTKKVEVSLSVKFNLYMADSESLQDVYKTVASNTESLGYKVVSLDIQPVPVEKAD